MDEDTTQATTSSDHGGWDIAHPCAKCGTPTPGHYALCAFCDADEHAGTCRECGAGDDSYGGRCAACYSLEVAD